MLSRLADHLLLMPGARESVQGDRARADLKLPPSPVCNRLSVSFTREALKAATTGIRSLPAYSPAEIEKLTCDVVLEITSVDFQQVWIFRRQNRSFSYEMAILVWSACWHADEFSGQTCVW